MYKTIDDLWRAAIEDVIHWNPITCRGGRKMREEIGVSMKLLNPVYSFLGNDRRLLSPFYAAAETVWYLNGSNNTSWLKQFAPSYEGYEDIPNFAWGAYGPRIVPWLPFVVEMIKKELNSRRVMIPIYRASDLVQVSKDIPCTANLKFYLRDEGLHMIADMRSNDVWKGLPYDVFAFTTIGKIVANSVGSELVTYTHQVGSLHLYEDDVPKAAEALKSGNEQFPVPFYDSMSIADELHSARTFNVQGGVIDKLYRVANSQFSSTVVVPSEFEAIIDNYRRRRQARKDDVV